MPRSNWTPSMTTEERSAQMAKAVETFVEADEHFKDCEEASAAACEEKIEARQAVDQIVDAMVHDQRRRVAHPAAGLED